MNADLTSMSRKELEKLKANVDKALQKLNEANRKAALAAAEKAAAAHGFKLSEITGDAAPVKTRKSAKPAKTAGKAKYRNPDNAAQTWTGKGRQPEWFKKAMANGISPDALAI